MPTRDAGARLLLAREHMANPRSRSPKSDRSDLLARKVRAYERSVITEYLEKHRGHVGETAAALGLSRRGLEKKMAAHGLQSLAGDLREKAGIGGPRS